MADDLSGAVAAFHRLDRRQQGQALRLLLEGQVFPPPAAKLREVVEDARTGQTRIKLRASYL